MGFSVGTAAGQAAGAHLSTAAHSRLPQGRGSAVAGSLGAALSPASRASRALEPLPLRRLRPAGWQAAELLRPFQPQFSLHASQVGQELLAQANSPYTIVDSRDAVDPLTVAPPSGNATQQLLDQLGSASTAG